MFKGSVFTFIFALSLLSLFVSCQKERKAKALPESASAWVYGFTSGVISKAEPIRVQFASLAVSEAEVGVPINQTLINISPSVAGKLLWEDRQTLRFEPEAHLQSGKNYLATVNLKKIFPEVPEDAESFEFDFRTRDQHFEMDIQGLNASDPKDLRKQELLGKILTMDVAESEAVEKILQATQGRRSLPVEWQHESDGREHSFIVKDIDRSEKASAIELSWNGKSIDVGIQDKRSIEVPSLDDFKVSDARAISQGKEQYILLHFTDPLLENQDLNGLIYIPGYDNNLRFLIDGNHIRVYPNGRMAGSHTISINNGIKNINSKKMKNPGQWEIDFQEAQPEVRLVGTGVIMPNSDGLIFPFEAISLNAVELEVFKIYHNNILQFLQSNELDGHYEMYRVGRIVMQKTISLKSLNPGSNASEWTRYAFDLSTLIKEDDHAIYQIRIGFRPEHSLHYCEQSVSTSELALVNEEGDYGHYGYEDEEYNSIMNMWYGFNGYYPGYQWDDRQDPCKAAYYNSERFVQRNVIASNLGLLAKAGADNTFFLVATDIRSAKPLSDVELEFYDFQQQLLNTASTDGEGMAQVKLDKKPFAVIAKQGNQRGYLKLDDGNSLSLSRFDVAGQKTQKGLKGFLYGERGVWRPGDSVYLNFVLEDKNGKLPANYPVTFELYDPRGQLQEKKVVAEAVNYVYPLYFKTDREAPTGYWQAKVKAGGATFEKSIRIETVKPNRIKSSLDFGKATLSMADEPIKASLQANWLHGAAAGNLNAKVEAELKGGKTSFEGFSQFLFDDPARSVGTESKVIFEGPLNGDGKASLNFSLTDNQQLPGKLTANFKTRVFEKGGDASTSTTSIPYHPFNAYVGIQVPKDQFGQHRLEINEKEELRFVSVSKEGKAQSNKKITVGLYRLDWRWWWDQNQDDISRYNTINHYDALKTQSLSTDQKGEAAWSLEVSEWGRYLIRVCDPETGHCSGTYFYAGYPWYDEGEEGYREGASMLSFSSDKTKYKVGETVVLKIPTGQVGKALITIENGTKVIESFWVDAKEGENTFQFKTKPEMAPTAYAHVSLLQPHAQVQNDLPIRLYGVIPIHVEDPATRLEPIANMPETLRPNQEFSVEVKEAEGREMAYTLAVVDEGLLGLTDFKTPNPWDHFYAREALGVKTWDVYDHVLGAFGGQLERLLSIGGDGAALKGAPDEKANRFDPVVIHLGPFYLKKGKKDKHQIKLPNYVGAVRVMVVASDNGAYGIAEKTVPVRQPLMVLATLPRQLSPGEQFSLPVNLFAMEDKVKQASVSVKESSGLVKFSNGTQQSASFSKPGDKLLNFDVTVGEKTGIARFVISASGHGESASQEVEIDIRNPNPYVTETLDKTLDNGDMHVFEFDPVGMPGTNEAILEVSNIPPINLGTRLNYLLRYPYGCIEQTVSSVFPQLYVNHLMDLNDEQKKKVPINVQAGIERLKQFQTSQGGFAYWPGNAQADQWASNYGGHFLLEAKALGYAVAPTLLEKWIDFQKKAAKLWDPKLEDYGFYSRNSYEHMQAYRLYTLALAGKPELGAMNRLRESANLSTQSRWRLAAAYALTGKKDIANKLVENISTSVSPYQELSYTYGSSLRDQAMILEALLALGERDKAGQSVLDISKQLNGLSWLSTQETAFSLLAIGKYVGESGVSKSFNFTYQVQNGIQVNAGSDHPVMQIKLPLNGTSRQKVTVKSANPGTLFAKVILSGQPAIGQEKASNKDLRMVVAFKGMDGQLLDPGQLKQGTDFYAEVSITHPGSRAIRFDEMALSQVFPSGWEIINTRLDALSAAVSSDRFDYQDIRDDRVNTFFDLGINSTATYRVQLNAAYQGRFYLPASSCTAMYDESIYARNQGQWVEVRAAKAG